MNDELAWGMCVVALAAGFAAGRHPVVGLAGLGLWAAGLAVAALLGAFRPTAEDNSLGMFLFTGLPTVMWVGFLIAGIALRQLLTRRRPTA